jgi:hypothetical protein
MLPFAKLHGLWQFLFILARLPSLETSVPILFMGDSHWTILPLFKDHL